MATSNWGYAGSAFGRRTRRNFARSFTPFVMPTLPAGSYDPSFNSQLRAAERGYADLTDPASGDLTRQQTRADVQRQWSLADLLSGRDRSVADIDRTRTQTQTGYNRSLSDLLRERTETGEDYQRNLSGLERQYGILKSNQEQAAARAGLSRGGALAQAMQKRAANMAWERQPIDTSYNRFMTRSRTGETRLGEDLQSNLGNLDLQRSRLLEDYESNRGRLLTQSQWGAEDTGIQASRALRELEQYRLDAEAAKLAQARGSLSAEEWAGFIKPANEFTSPGGTTYRVVMVGGKKRYRLPSGVTLSTRPA